MHVNFRGAKALRKIGINTWDEPVFGQSKTMTLHGLVEDDPAPFVHTDGSHTYSIDRQEYFELLLDRVKKDNNIQLHFGKEFDTLDFDNAVLDFNGEKVQYPWIFGMDGVNSKVRRELQKL